MVFAGKYSSNYSIVIIPIFFNEQQKYLKLLYEVMKS